MICGICFVGSSGCNAGTSIGRTCNWPGRVLELHPARRGWYWPPPAAALRCWNQLRRGAAMIVSGAGTEGSTQDASREVLQNSSELGGGRGRPTRMGTGEEDGRRGWGLATRSVTGGERMRAPSGRCDSSERKKKLRGNPFFSTRSNGRHGSNPTAPTRPAERLGRCAGAD